MNSKAIPILIIRQYRDFLFYTWIDVIGNETNSAIVLRRTRLGECFENTFPG